MLKNDFYAAVDSLYAKIRATQDKTIEQAAELIADRVSKGGAVNLFDTGHLIDSELLNRAGGLVLYRRFRYGLNVENDIRPRDLSGKDKSMQGLAEYALRASQMLPGDVLIIGSVSGKTMNVIDLAIEAKKMGIAVVTLSSFEYSSKLESAHSSKLHLYEIGDVNIDNCAPFGDGMLPVDAFEAKLIPASGLAAAYIMWALTAELTERLIAKGFVPSALKSVNFPENVEYNNKLYERYKNEGI